MKASLLRRRLWVLPSLLALGAFLFVACGGGSARSTMTRPPASPPLLRMTRRC